MHVLALLFLILKKIAWILHILEAAEGSPAAAASILYHVLQFDAAEVKGKGKNNSSSR